VVTVPHPEKDLKKHELASIKRQVEAKTAKLNYSQILQDGLMERLGIQHNIQRR